ncbi:MAG: hypothetical protein L0Y54_10595 [Sporichthyaceae bacterium]|nr:hypothetical protein [Sporichthyaceae bacterium]
MSSAHYPEPAGSADRPGRGVTEVLIAVIVAALVASIVVLFGSRGDASGDPGAGGSGTPTVTSLPTVSLSPTPSESSTPTGEPTETDEPIEVTRIDVSADPREFVGACPATVTIQADIFTNTGPVTAHYRWLRAGEPGPEQTVRFGGPGPQRVTVTDEIEAQDDTALPVALQVSEPNEVTSDAVEVSVTCTPTARTSLEFDAICQIPYTIHFRGSITVPHGPMTVTYTWERSDGATGPDLSVSFPAGGKQTQSVPDNTWSLSTSGEFSQRIKILSPFEYTSNWSKFTIC